MRASVEAARDDGTPDDVPALQVAVLAAPAAIEERRMTTQPTNMTLYRLLVQLGASEPEAVEAARLEVSDLVTKADLKAELAEFKSALLVWLVGLFIGQTALLLTVLRMVRP